MEETRKYRTTFHQYFAVIADLIEANEVLCKYFIFRETLTRLIDYYMGTQSPLFRVTQYAETRAPICDSSSGFSPNMVEFMRIFYLIVSACHTDATPMYREKPPTAWNEDFMIMSDRDKDLLHNKSFLDSFMKMSYCSKSNRIVLSHLCWMDLYKTQEIAEIITAGLKSINHMQSKHEKNLLEALSVILSIDDELQMVLLTIA